VADQPSGLGDLRVSGDRITTLTAGIDEVLGGLRGQHTQLTGVVDSVAAGWRGDAASQFASGQNETNLNLDRLTRALENLRELVQMSRDGFTQEEQDRAAELRSVQSNLQGMGSPGIAGLET
jgi:WXG100 family type VII secretion target